ncbi:beta-galactosidase [Actinopolymorpha singaporensis]|uniref:beta-galactosidase n=1 Tax=Actinopolymorpha singaporensis TaxID=117157 RepID=A0A1H1TVB4_9ACTN|nr:beta-galactosidase [Actinopolymorpha singaporensis]SDS64223.1 beta-galactosidase [Actinopolymorpha singaporensis]
MLSSAALPAFPYGAVYFRKTNPPCADWDRDYQTAADDGHNAFRHWFLWSAVEVTPGEFDWSDYDRQLDLAAENGIRTIVAEMMTSAPEWAFRSLAHARYVRRDGTPVRSGMSPSCAVGGFPGLCLDNADARERAGAFLTALVTRYRNHPGLGGYDIWNECGYAEDVCYCPATAAAFRSWLRERYGDLRTLGQAWGRYSYAEWDDIEPPRTVEPYADVLDWLEFRQDNAYRLMRWRADLIRALDPDHPVTAHGVAGSLTHAAPRGTDDWRAAAEVESYGLTWGSSRHGDEPWKQMHAMDLVRSASRGKPFWHAEAYAGPLWMQPQVVGKPRDEGRIASVEDVRYWNLASFACGASGLFYLRWRPLLDGPLFGAFGAYGMDGSRTPRSDMVSRLARWATAPEQEGLWRSRPVPAEVGIVYCPETQIFTYAQQRSTDFYARAVQGAYQGFLANNIQASFVHVDDVVSAAADAEGGETRIPSVLYLPYPVMLNRATTECLAAWVEAGGTLVTEGCPGYFADLGRVGTSQPGNGLDKLFGARETYVEFTPDLLDDLTFSIDGSTAHGGIFLQAYEPTTGTPVGWYADGRVAAVDHQIGAGRTRLVGTFPGAGFGRHHDQGTRSYFARLLEWAGVRQLVRVSESRVIARVHDGEGGRYLWLLNPGHEPVRVTATLAAHVPGSSGLSVRWGDPARVGLVDGRSVDATIGARDAVLCEV